ncbi:DUF4012 domain-containing protein [Nonomuraea cavernae]|uniref:DUF4012 domain-containing protein n=1 Tax=Nonomuraea cavernae TaxID=2045107 RepID=A0A918DI78_9ACTN|nr:DUF4012 domain-containing protein [Nonomuraea cavernae]MCA2185166.1 DUF4012 domain-containing protein [Nonomuraea cavernae]GGO65611.1 hypothetical protein GCM10012289_17710 [Nonomuraea cavernae]
MRADKRRRFVTFGLLVPAAGLVAAGGWSAYLGRNVQVELQATKDILAGMRESEPRQLGEALARARLHAHEALRLTSGPDWSLISRSPVVGDGATTVRGLAEAAAELTEVLTDVHGAGAKLMASGGFAMGDIHEFLPHLEAAAPTLDTAAGRIAAARARLAATPADTGLATLDAARGTALHEVDRLSGWLDLAADAGALLPPMLGNDGPRRYFLGFQTNAEARGTGGLVGAFGILKTDRGKFGIERLAANSGLEPISRPVVDHGRAFRSRYGESPLYLLANSNLSPHFPYAARTWTALWERQTHQRLDGAIATDPVGLSYLLQLIGPVTLPGGEKVTADNVIDLTERTAYERFSNQWARKRFLITIATAVSEALPRASIDPAALMSTLSRIAEERRIQIWSRRDAEQKRLAATPLAGELPRRPEPFAGLVVNNSGGNKLDYYLKRSLEYELGPCRADGTRVSRVRVGLFNDVPRGKLAPYASGRLDSPNRHHARGSNLLWVSLFASVGSKSGGMKIDGKPANLFREVERSHPVYSTMLELGPRQTRTLEFLMLEPVTAAPPRVPVQPLVHPQRTQIIENPDGCAFGAGQEDR